MNNLKNYQILYTSIKFGIWNFMLRLNSLYVYCILDIN